VRPTGAAASLAVLLAGGILIFGVAVWIHLRRRATDSKLTPVSRRCLRRGYMRLSLECSALDPDAASALMFQALAARLALRPWALPAEEFVLGLSGRSGVLVGFVRPHCPDLIATAGRPQFSYASWNRAFQTLKKERQSQRVRRGVESPSPHARGYFCPSLFVFPHRENFCVRNGGRKAQVFDQLNCSFGGAFHRRAGFVVRPASPPGTNQYRGTSIHSGVLASVQTMLSWLRTVAGT